MLAGLVSLLKRLDLLSFFCEELCRWCGRPLDLSMPVTQSVLGEGTLSPFKTATLCQNCYFEMRKASGMVWWLPISVSTSMAPFAAGRYDPLKLNHLVERVECHDSCCDDDYFNERVELLPIATAGRYEGPLQKLIRRLKYDDDLLVARDIAPMITDAFDLLVEVNEDLRVASPVVAIPVPLYSSRRKQRGYNQAEVIAQQLACKRDVVLRPNALRRKRETRPQYGLTKLERSANVSGAFIADGALVSGRTVLLVDDVFTSGATLRECANALKFAGATNVSAVAAAMAPLKSKC